MELLIGGIIIMRKLTMMIPLFFCILLLSACSDKISEIKEAASGIDHAANKAAKAISLDAHSIRSIEIEHKNTSFTVNDLFKSILRDVFWEYEEKNEIHTFVVKGTWKELLFEEYNFTEEQKTKLKDEGTVTVELELVDGAIKAESTTVQMTLDGELLVDEKGEDTLYSLYNQYINN